MNVKVMGDYAANVMTSLTAHSLWTLSILYDHLFEIQLSVKHKFLSMFEVIDLNKIFC